VTDPFMAVPGMPGIWALGDNAAVPNAAANGEISPPTAQYALRQGKRLADNLAAVLRGQPRLGLDAGPHPATRTLVYQMPSRFVCNEDHPKVVVVS
jgi:NADH dehydrogenase FAD-containing subunit